VRRSGESQNRTNFAQSFFFFNSPKNFSFVDLEIGVVSQKIGKKPHFLICEKNCYSSAAKKYCWMLPSVLRPLSAPSPTPT